MVQGPFGQQKQKMTMYFFVSSFLIPFLLGILFVVLSIIFVPDLVDFSAANAMAESTFDSSVVYSADAEQAAFLEERGVNVVLVSEEEAKEAVAGQVSAYHGIGAKMLPYLLYSQLAYYVLALIAYLLWLRVFLFERDFLGFKLSLKGTREVLELTYKRLGQIAWALAWRWFAAWLMLAVAVLVCGSCLGIVGALIGGTGFYFISSIWHVLSPFVALGIGIYSHWRICAFLVESLLKVEFSDFKVVFAQNIDRDMMHQIREDLFKQAPVPTMRMRLATLEHWSGA